MPRKQSPDPGTSIAKAPKGAERQKMTPGEQRAEFERVAREHDAEGDEVEFENVLRKLAKRKA